MTEHPNAARIREAVAAFNQKDHDELFAHWVDDPVFHHAGNTPRAGTYRGRDEFARLLDQEVRHTGGTMRLEPVDVLADDEHAVVFFKATGTREGASLDTTVAYAARLDSDGRQVEGWFLASDQAAWDGFNDYE